MKPRQEGSKLNDLCSESLFQCFTVNRCVVDHAEREMSTHLHSSSAEANNEIESGSTRSYCMENSPWKRPRTCRIRQATKWMNESVAHIFTRRHICSYLIQHTTQVLYAL
jgi:hypothetical protein